MDPPVTAATSIFLEAAYDGTLRRFKRCAADLGHLLRDGVPAILENAKDDDGRRAIHHAAAGGNVQVLKYLIEEIKLDIEVKDNSGETPLNWATIEGRLAAVEYLLQMGANPEVPNDLDCSPLHHAAMRGHTEIIPLLLSKGINVDVTNELGSPLQYAAAHGYHDVVKVLLDHGANPNSLFHDALTPLHSSIHSQSLQCVVSLLKAGADPNLGPDGKPLTIAAEVGVIQIIKLLLEAGADPNATQMLICKAEEYFLELRSRGTSAFQRKEYSRAVYWYSEALIKKPADAVVLSNRSLCYVYLNKGDFALEDATRCKLARPDWPKAHYRAGVALKMLNRLDDAADAFFKGLKLDPNNKELEDAFRGGFSRQVEGHQCPTLDREGGNMPGVWKPFCGGSFLIGSVKS